MRPSEAARLAREALAAGNTTLARSIAEHLLAEYGRYPPARLVRALLAEQADDTDAALDDLRAVTSTEPCNAEARAAQARLFRRRGDLDRARMAARQAVELIPSDPEVLGSALEVLDIDAAALDASASVLARVHLNCGWPDLAERHARLAVSESPERVDVRLTLAESLWRLGRLPACEAECRVVADQAEECVRAAVMRAHILSERGRTAEGQELLDRIGRIDPEFREARELLGTVEVHRLVLPEAAAITLPQELLALSNGAASSAGQQLRSDNAELAPSVLAGPSRAPAQWPVESPQPELAAAEGEEPLAADEDRGDDPSGEAAERPDRPGTSPGQLLLETASADSAAAEAAAQPAAEAAGNPDPTTDDASSTPSFSTFDWARHLIQESNWAEAERVLTDIVSGEDADEARVDGLLLEAVAHRELRGPAWKLLGDHYMRTDRPQAAADAYLRAANVSGQSSA